LSLPTYSNTYDAVEAMQDAFTDFWGNQTIQPKLSYDNVDLDVPGTDLTMTSSDSDVSGEGFALVQVVHATGNIAALGTKMFRQIGIMNIAIYVETNKGRKRAGGKIADQALDFFQTENIAGVTFQNPRMNEVGNDGRWYQVNVTSDFLYDIVRS